ncbi:glycosyltransferase family 1 protein [Aestuariicella hydrocarbonica]|uniref:Glycosyltransferase family 1 protein n=1 Tax=Pseudomaricurvus hydrocarbonicus TaxID=1470433 RepID=A0A9E5JTA4_9GAMM|nr:glycosyltransferase family 1 protein [Aestuariicella hydrocarbonica]
MLPDLPVALAGLKELATDLRWTWSHAADALWQQVDAELWGKTENPYVLLQNVGHNQLQALADNPDFCHKLQEVLIERQDYLARCGWYGDSYPQASIRHIAFFSMEYGLGTALPFYAGGLGILSGDILKAASDLCIPLVGVGLLYHQGYFRQMIDADNRQHEIYTTYQPSMLPVRPVFTELGDWLQVKVDLPGRPLLLRVWVAQVGSVSLYLLDSNHPLNSPIDQGITSQLYGGGQELRFLQELVLGVGGWRALEALKVEIDVCHLNEGHAAFVILERTHSLMKATGLSFWPSLWINRAGTLFTTHTSVASAFDTYDAALIARYASPLIERLQIGEEELLGLGRKNPQDAREPFNLAWFSMRCSLFANGVSRKHGETSRDLFRELYPHWPVRDIPIGHITNGIHMPSWDSQWTDSLWTKAAGKERWKGDIDELASAINQISDQELWHCRNRQRQDLIEHVRKRHVRELSQRGADKLTLDRAERVLDPNILTLGFARRFTEYKRPGLLLMDLSRLAALLNHPVHPLQILIAGKAHARDSAGKAFVHDWAQFCQSPAAGNRVIFLEDYDITLAHDMVQGVDVWLNTPKPPWEACGTSGMKVLVNGGLNLSVLDGWWAQAYDNQYGWAICGDSDSDEDTSRALFELLETDVVPLFYQRNSAGVPGEWIARIRASMADLTPHFSSNRMLRDYIDQYYLKAAVAYQARLANRGQLATELREWEHTLQRYWCELRWGAKRVVPNPAGFTLEVDIYLDGLSPDLIEVQLYADAQIYADVQQKDAAEPECLIMKLLGYKRGAIDSYTYRTEVLTARPSDDYTPRAIPFHEHALTPQENCLISWWQSA